MTKEKKFAVIGTDHRTGKTWELCREETMEKAKASMRWGYAYVHGDVEFQVEEVKE